jgi:hypothetical protein
MATEIQHCELVEETGDDKLVIKTHRDSTEFVWLVFGSLLLFLLAGYLRYLDIRENRHANNFTIIVIVIFATTNLIIQLVKG